MLLAQWCAAATGCKSERTAGLCGFRVTQSAWHQSGAVHETGGR